MPSIPLKYVVSFSSQDEKHPVSNLIKGDGYKKWLSGAQDKSGQTEAVFQLEQPCIISYIDIDVFCPDIAKQRWDRIKVVCLQPYKKPAQFGLSFLRVRTSSSMKPGDPEQVPVGIAQEPRSVAVQSIQKHFLGKIQNKQKENRDDLKTRLLKISASSDSGVEHGDSLSRTAKLVLAANGPRPKVFSAGSPAPNAEKAGLFSSCIDQKYGPKFEEEVNLFLSKLEVNAGDLDSITLADVRHKFEKRKKRKLTKEEKRFFIALAKDFLTEMFTNKAKEDKVKPTVSNDNAKLLLTEQSSVKAAQPNITAAQSNIKAAPSNVNAAQSNVKAAAVTSVSSREATLSHKRKFNSSDETVTPPSKKAMTEKSVPFKQQMKTFEQSPSTVGAKVINNPLKEKLTGKRLPGSTCQGTPMSPFQYKGLRGGDAEWKENHVINKDVHVSNVLNNNKHVLEGADIDVVCISDKWDVNKDVVGVSNFGNFGVNVPWSPANIESKSPAPFRSTAAKSRGKTKGRGTSRGRGRGRGRGRKKLDLPVDLLSSDSDSDDCCYSLPKTETPEVKGPGRGTGRGKGKTNGSVRTNTAALEIRPTGFAKCDGCNEYYGENLLSVHQQRCQRWKHLQTASPATPKSPWLSARPQTPKTPNTTDTTPSRQPKAPKAPKTNDTTPSRQHQSACKSSSSESVRESSSVKSPPWLLAAEKRLQQQAGGKSTNSDCDTRGSNAQKSPNYEQWGGNSSLETSPVIEAQMQQTVKYQSSSQNRLVNNTDKYPANTQPQSNHSDNQSADPSFGFSLGFSPMDDYVDSDSESNEKRGTYISEPPRTDVECPLCAQFFPSHIIEMHAATCFS